MTVTQPNSPTAASKPISQASTLTAIDLFRGLTILEVVLHHTTGMALRYVTRDSMLFSILSIVNRSLHFAVPAFVFLSSVLLTNSLLKRFNLKTYVTRRVVRGAWPYLLWSVLYVFWSVWLGNRPPEVLTDPAKWEFYLLYGKANFHMYFLLVALEVYFVLPLLLPLARRKWPIALMFVLGCLVQFGVLLLNRHVLKLQFPASTVLWYLLPVLLGVGVGARLSEFAGWWRRNWVWLVGAVLLAYAVYLPTALALMRGERIDSLFYNTQSWLFTALMALNLLGFAYWWHGRAAPTTNEPDADESLPSPVKVGLGAKLSAGLRGALALLGTVSLQVYLIHPALQQILERWAAPTGSDTQRLLTVLLYGAIALLLPALLGRLLWNTKLSRFLFGR